MKKLHLLKRIRPFALSIMLIAWLIAAPGAVRAGLLYGELQRHDLRGIRSVLHQYPNAVNEIVDSNRPITPLQFAVLDQQKEIIALLLSKGAMPDVFTAAGQGDLDRLSRLLDQDPKLVSARDGEGITPLHFAVLCGQRDAVKLLLDHKADVNAKPEPDSCDWSTPLHCAVRDDDLVMAKLLLDHGADPLVTHDYGKTLLHDAVWNDDPALLELLLACKLDVNAKSDQGRQTPLHYAAFGGYMRSIQFLLEHGADIDAVDGAGHTPIHVAAQWGPNPNAAEELLRRGAKLDYITAVRLGCVKEAAAFIERDPKLATRPSVDGGMQMSEAAAAGHEAMVRLLLDHGASPDRDVKGCYTPLHEAATNGHADVVQLLLDRGARIDPLANGRDSPLCVAASRGQVDVVRLLIKRGASLTGAGGESPFWIAAQYGQKEIVEILWAEAKEKHVVLPLDSALIIAARIGNKDEVEFLIAQGAVVQPSFPSGRGVTALQYAAGGGNKDIVALLLDKGAAIDAPGLSGATPLHDAAHVNRLASAAVLLEHGAAVNTVNDEGETPLHLAARNSDLPLVQLLLDHKADATVKDKAGKLPWELADAEGQDEIAALLRKAIRR